MRHPPYVRNPYVATRRVTREVRVGDVGVGAANPIRVQSMTNTDTMDTQASADQVEALAHAGCEIVRLTAPSKRDAENLREIVCELRRRGVSVPLVADIHFTPNAALIAAEFVEKVRVNPGNYADRKKFEVREYSDSQYQEELERVAERFRPLVRRCQERGVALRIGTNHGSLSDRIMNRYGDTPLGMVESALEFLDVCEAESYRDVIFSMKASNTQVAIQAYRLLAARLEQRAPDVPSYPFHVGVTEAGDGEDGRIKSAIGIGSLLEDGIGDTVRVSLTEDPVKEVPVARALALRAEARWREDEDAAPPLPALAPDFVADPYAHARRETKAQTLGSGDAAIGLGGGEPVRVELGLGEAPADKGRLAALAARTATSLATAGDLLCEGLLFEAPDPAALSRAAALPAALVQVGLELPLAIRKPAACEAPLPSGFSRCVVQVTPETRDEALMASAGAAIAAGMALEWSLAAEVDEVPALLDRVLAAGGPGTPLVSADSRRATHAARALAAHLRERGREEVPILLRSHRREPASDDEAVLELAIDLGAALCDGIGDAVSLTGFADPARALDLAYRVLQGARLRTTRTEYISCPSCGRTLFDLEETTARIKQRTEHLKGVKIAVMGCIVNGPGEMADADFGYVGTGPGRVSLYVGKDVVARAVDESEAPDRLIEIIREQGAWVEPV